MSAAAAPKRGLVLGAGGVLGAAAMLGSGLGVEQLINHQRGIVVPGDPDIDFNPDTASGGSLPPRPQWRLGSTALIARSVRHPRRMPVPAALAGLAPRGRGSLAAVGDLVRAANPDGGWPTAPAIWIVAMDYDSGRRVV